MSDRDVLAALYAEAGIRKETRPRPRPRLPTAQENAFQNWYAGQAQRNEHPRRFLTDESLITRDTADGRAVPSVFGSFGERGPLVIPRQMRPPSARANDPRLAPSERERARQTVLTMTAANEAIDRTAIRPPSNQFVEAGRGASEMVGIAPLARVARDFNTGDPARVTEDALMGGLGVLGMIPAFRSGAAAMPRVPMATFDAPTRLPVNPARDLGPNALPIRPSEPFRNSLRGGSDDLMAAARSAPDAGQRQGGNVRTGDAFADSLLDDFHGDAEAASRAAVGIGSARALEAAEKLDALRGVTSDYSHLRRPDWSSNQLADWQQQQRRISRAEMLRDERAERGIRALPRSEMAPGSNQLGGIERLETKAGQPAMYEFGGPDDSRFRVTIAPTTDGSATVQFTTLSPLITENTAVAREFYNRALATVFDDARRNGRASYRFAWSGRRDTVHEALLRAAERQGDLPEGYRLDISGQSPRLVRIGPASLPTRSAPDGSTGQPIRAFHGTDAEIEGGFNPGSHFGTEAAANARLRDNRVSGGRVHAVELPAGRYLRVPEAGNMWDNARWWQEEARAEIKSAIPREERALWEAIESDRALREARGPAVTRRLGEIMREHGFEGGVYRNRWEGGDSYFMPDASRVRGGGAAPVEGSVQAGDVLDWLGNDRLIRNPTEADLRRLAELGDEMKYVMDTDGNIYAFSAADAHHNNAMRALRDNGVTVRSLGPGAEITDPDAAGFIWRNRDGSFSHEDANMRDSGPYSAFQERMRRNGPAVGKPDAPKSRPRPRPKPRLPMLNNQPPPGGFFSPGGPRGA